MTACRLTRIIQSMVLGSLILCFLAVCYIPAFAQGNNYTGLWVGTATINGVSQVNRTTPDLSFDLGLTGIKDTQILIPRKSSGWAYDKTDTLTDLSWTTGSDAAANWITDKQSPLYAYQTGTPIGDHQQITTYFRKLFQSGDTSTYKGLTLRVWVNGGVAVYLNGSNVLQENLSSLQNNSPALSETEGIQSYEINLPLTSLYTNTDNAIAAALYSADTSNSESFFDLELIAITTMDTDEALVPKEAPGWTCNDSGIDPGLSWINQGYDDSSWLAGCQAPFYQHKLGTALAGNHGSAYFRKNFQVEDPSLHKNLRMRVWRDDGIVIYLNGQEVYRNNMPWGSMTPEAKALYDLSENRPIDATLSDTQLLAGENWIAAVVYPFGDTDNDLYFDVELITSVEEVLVPTGAYGWKFSPTTDTQEPYLAPPDDYLGRSWNGVEYNDIDWAEGQAELGFGDGDEKTVLGYNTQVWPRTIYFRHTFRPQTSGFDTLQVQLLCDDSAVVYLNGTEIMRSNLLAGIIEYGSAPVSAVGSSAENTYIVDEINLKEYESLLLQDRNVVAVEVHQHSSELGDPDQSQTAVTPTPANLDLRLILHSNSTGEVKLLKEVYQMYRRVNNDLVPVLLPDDMQIPDFEGPGWRLSTVSLDFEGVALAGNGIIGATGQVTFNLTLPANHPTNPFLHHFHPDHDNWDARYEKKYPFDDGAPEEAFKVERSITLVFEEKYPPGCGDTTCRQIKPPGWGDSSIGGTYTELIKGLHRDDITVTGSFMLDRISTIDQLEQ